MWANMTEAELRQLYPALPPLQHNAGWLPLVEHCLAQMAKAGLNLQQPRVLQIKQKLGSLRIHIDTSGMSEPQRTAIALLAAQALTASRSVCELCGQDAQLRVGASGCRTLCALHAQGTLPHPSTFDAMDTP